MENKGAVHYLLKWRNGRHMEGREGKEHFSNDPKILNLDHSNVGDAIKRKKKTLCVLRAQL